MHRAWQRFWAWAGRVPLRQKIIGIVVGSLLIHGFAIGFWVRAGLGGWLSYLLAEERVQQAMAAGTRGVFIITLLATFTGLVFAWMLTWVLTRPILSITRVAQMAERGDLSHRAPVWANDEIGQLGLAFNAMIESMAQARRELETSNIQLRRRNQELALLYELAGLACQPANLQVLLDRALEQMLRITPAHAGFIALRRAPGQPLEPVTLINLAPQEIPAGTLEIAGHSRGEDAQGEGAKGQGEPTSQEILAPIQTQDEVEGLLALFATPGAPFGPADQALAEAVCSALSIALQNARLWDELKKKEASRAKLLAKVVAAQEEERQRISRELHDETGQSLTTLLVQLKVLENLDDPQEVRQRIFDLRALTSQALEEVRRLALDLRPAALDDLGLVAATEGFVAEHARVEGLQIHFNAQHFGEDRLPRDMETVLYRIIQEAMTNIIRHAHARQAWIELARDQEGILLAIRDDGCGFDPQAVSASSHLGMGLLGMQERAELIGATFILRSAPGQGTEIRITAPLPERVSNG
jgi:signal transduction histidine kinase